MLPLGRPKIFLKSFVLRKRNFFFQNVISIFIKSLHSLAFPHTQTTNKLIFLLELRQHSTLPAVGKNVKMNKKLTKTYFKISVRNFLVRCFVAASSSGRRFNFSAPLEPATLHIETSTVTLFKFVKFNNIHAAANPRGTC